MRSKDVSTSLASASDYVALLKPRVMSLVVFTAFVGWVAAPGDVDPVLGVASVLALALGAGGAGALNMWFDADIDTRMKRTLRRPIPSGRVDAEEALMFGLVMSALACILMALAGGALASGLLAFTIAFYAVVYTMWLKRRTPYNVVIGGLAGALPPAVAWAAKAGEVSADPLVLVLIIFLWTPPHSWALALFRRDDYAAAQVPMLPVAKGVAATKSQIVIYSLLLAPATLLLVATGLGGAFYAVVAAVGGVYFVAQSVRLAASDAERLDERARALFLGSLTYLFALFAAILFEALFGKIAL